MNKKDWEKQFDKKFTRKSKGLEDKGKYMDRWFVRETTSEELKDFIKNLLSQSNQEIVKEIEGLKCQRYWNDNPNDYPVTDEECSDYGKDILSKEVNQKIDKLLTQLRQSNNLLGEK